MKNYANFLKLNRKKNPMSCKGNFLALVLGTFFLMQGAEADVKVGFLGTMTGPSADVGRDQIDGFSLALEQLGGKLGGVPASLVKEDDQQKPEVALAGLTKLLDRDKVDVVTGLTFAQIFMALQGKVGTTDVPFIGTVSGPSATAGAQCKRNLFVMSWNSDVPAEAMGKHLTDKGIKRISILTPNFLGGKDKITGLKRYFKGEIVDEIYTPLNQLDFSAELSQVANSKPDAIFAFYPGSLGVTFARQYQQAGLLGKIPFYSTNTIEGSYVEAMGSAAIGAIVTDSWTPGNTNAQSKQFVSAFEKRYGRVPSTFAAFSYDAAMLLDSAVRSVKGNTTDRKALNQAITNAQFKSVRGDFRFGNNNYPIQNYNVYQVARTLSGKPEFKMIVSDVLKSHADSYAAQCAIK